MINNYMYKSENDKRNRREIPIESWFIMIVSLIGMQACVFMQTVLPDWNDVICFGFFVFLYLLLGSLVWAVIREPVLKLELSASEWTGALVILAIVASVIGLGIISFLQQEQTIKTWDFSVYWEKLIEHTRVFFVGISESINKLVASFSGEYSDLAVIPLVPFAKCLGFEFYQYVIYVYVLYAVPVCLLFAIYITSIYTRITGLPAKSWHIAVSGTAAFLCVPLLQPVILGYVDIGGLVLVALLFTMAFDWKWARFSFEKNLLLAILSLLLILIRRWYAFFIVAYYFSFGIEYIFSCLLDRKNSIKKALFLAGNLLFIAAICLLWVLCVTPDTLQVFFGVNYSKAYTAYKVRTDWCDLLYFMKDYGLVFIVLSIVGLTFTLFNKNSRFCAIRWIATFSVSFLLFERIQSAGVQHRYLFVPYVVFGLSILLLLLARLGKRWLHVSTAAIVIGLMVWNVGMAYTTKLPTIGAGSLMTQVHIEPDIRFDLNTIKNVLSYVNKRADEDHELFYVVGDSDTISQEVLKRAFMPSKTNAAENVISGSIIDLRDGFPSSAFIGDYVLVPVPMQSEHDVGREVIAQLYELFEDNPMTAEFYKVIHWEFGDGITYKLYHRIRPVTKRYVDELRTTLQAYYPDDPFVYEPNYFLSLISLDTKDNYNYYSWGSIIDFVPENKAAVRWETSKEFSSLSIDYVNWNEGVTYTAYADGVAVGTNTAEIGKANMEFDVTGVQQFSLVFESASMNGARFSIQMGTLK